MKIPLAGALVAVLLLIAVSAMAQQAGRTAYKCVHADGRVEYTALPLDGAECERVGGWSPAPSEPEPPATSEPEPEPEESAEAEDPRQRNCQQARSNLEILESEAEVAMTGADGNAVVLDADQRAAALQQARRDVDYWCE